MPRVWPSSQVDHHCQGTARRPPHARRPLGPANGYLISKILVNSHRVQKAEIDPGVRSDHSAISLGVLVAGWQKRPGSMEV